MPDHRGLGLLLVAVRVREEPEDAGAAVRALLAAVGDVDGPAAHVTLYDPGSLTPRLRAQLAPIFVQGEDAAKFEALKDVEGEAPESDDIKLARATTALRWLVDLKDGPRDAAYEEQKPKAWAMAREVLGDE